MPPRVIAFFLVFVLLCSGLGTIEAPRVASQPSPGQHVIAHAGGPAVAHEGSVDHHHLDDLPSQAQNDPPTDTPGLLSAPPEPSAPSLVTGRPRTISSAPARSPYLAGPLRPPCEGAVAG